ncbi:MAG: T9SS type A sorting domain-containing protein [Bacteroidales bacterium]|nr:T9SS type A sorting domain-containing protein [Bacteroidales bacterium]
MKKHLLFSIVLLISAFFAKAQCPGCITDFTCTANPAAPTMCPDTLPEGTAMTYYEEDLSFYMPAQFTDQGTGMNVTLNELHVTGVSGMPYGLQFESSSATNIFYPSSNPPTTEYGCARFCGTPLIPGDYHVTVYVTAYVTVLGLSQTEYDSFEIPIHIKPNPTSNSSFTIANPVGCNPLTTGITTNYPSGGNPNYSYTWDFGNGNTSSQETPTAQTYTSPGTYYVSCETIVDTLDYSISSVTVVNSDCSDMGFEPDYYIKIFEGTTEIFNNSSSHATNQTPATFTFTSISLSNTSYSIEVWDNDDILGGGQSGDDHCGTVTFNGHTPGAYTLVDGLLTVTFSVNHPILSFSDTDSVVVYPSPQISAFEAIPNDTICDNDSLYLRVVGGESWQWYMNGSGIPSATDSIYVPLIDGAYSVVLSNSYGCMLSTNNIYVAFLAAPPYPNFYQNGNLLFCTNAGYQYQWYLDGVPISGADQQTYTITQTGNYTIELIASNGCSTFSTPYYAIVQAIFEYDIADLQIYPNPVNTRINFNADYDQHYYRIIDVLGNVVQEGRVDGSSVDVSDLGPAAYFIQIISPDKQYQATFVKE